MTLRFSEDMQDFLRELRAGLLKRTGLRNAYLNDVVGSLLEWAKTEVEKGKKPPLVAVIARIKERAEEEKRRPPARVQGGGPEPG